MRSDIQGLTQNFRVSIRDKNKAETRRRILNQIATNTQPTENEITGLREALLVKGNLADSLKPLKFVSMKTDVLAEFLPMTQALLELGLTTASMDVFTDCFTVLVNMTACPKFRLPLQSVAKLMKMIPTSGKRELIQTFLSNSLQEVNGQLMTCLLQNGILEYTAKRLKMVFTDSDQELNYLSFVCGLMVNSKQLSGDVLKDIVGIVSGTQIVERQEGNWIYSAGLAQCGTDLRLVPIVLAGESKKWFESVLTSKNSKLILNLLKFLINVSCSVDQFGILNDTRVFDWLRVTWESRHPSVKPLIVQIVSNFSSVPAIKKLSLFLVIMNLTNTFESQMDVLKFQLGRLILLVLKYYKSEWASGFLAYGLITHIKYMLNNQNHYMILLGLQILANILELDKSLVESCERQNIHIDLERLQQHPSDQVYKCSKYLIELHFKV